MTRSFRAAALSAIGAGAIAACASHAPAAPSVATPVRITVLGVNDFHGAIEERTVLVKTSSGATAELRVGGAALLASYLKRLRDQNHDGTIVLSAGDMWQGSIESNYFEGRPVVMLDNAIGYDATAVGNHEFDYGPAGPVALSAPSDPPAVRFSALEARRREAHFPFLAANVSSTVDGVPSFPASVLIERKGVKIGVIGLSTVDTPNTTQPANLVGLSFDPPAPAVVRAAADLRARGADAIVVTAHIGGNCRRNTPPDDASACEQDEEVMRLLAEIPAGTIDAFVAGHTHQFMAHVIHGVPVIESGAYGLAIGHIELEIDRAAHRVVGSQVLPPQPVCRDVLAETGTCAPGSVRSARVEQATLLGGPIEPDVEVARILAPFRQEVAEMKSAVLATAERPIGAARAEPSEIGVLVCDEMRAASKRYADIPDADFAVQNSGGLRSGLPAGPITWGRVYEVLPFDNVLASFQATGEKLEALFTTVARTGRVFQTSGLSMELAGDGERATVKLYDLSTGKRLGAKKIYTVVWNDFLANGGDGTRDALTGIGQTLHPGHLLRDVVIEGLKARKAPINSAQEPLLDPKKVRLKRVK